MKTNVKYFAILTLFMLILPLEIYGQNADPVVYAVMYPEKLTVGETMTLALLIDYPVPASVNVTAPPFADFVSLIRVRKTPRNTGTQTQTLVEYRFMLNAVGRFFLDPFSVVTPSGATEAGPFSVNIRAKEEEQPVFFAPLFWENTPRQMAAGESATLTLRANNADLPLPPPEFFLPETPQGVILSLDAAQESEGGIAAQFTLIPVSVGDFRMGERTLQHENIRFVIPALSIRITDSAPKITAPPAETTAAETSRREDPRFPDFVFAGHQALRAQCEIIYNTAKELWDGGFRARSLAELRRGERDHPAGAALAPIRRQAEENALVFNTENESRKTREFLLWFFSLMIFLVIFIPFVCFVKVKKFSRGKPAVLCAAIFAVLVSFCLYRFMDLRFAFRGKSGRFGVTVETPVRRTADTDAKELVVFEEGRPVEILLNSGSWVYIRSNDAAGVSGWIPAEAIEFY